MDIRGLETVSRETVIPLTSSGGSWEGKWASCGLVIGFVVGIHEVGYLVGC